MCRRKSEIDFCLISSALISAELLFEICQSIQFGTIRAAKPPKRPRETMTQKKRSGLSKSHVYKLKRGFLFSWFWSLGDGGETFSGMFVSPAFAERNGHLSV